MTHGRLILIAAVLATAVVAPLMVLRVAPNAVECPPGYRVFKEDARKCIAVKHPEPPFELILRQREWLSVRAAPFEREAPGAYSSALAEREQLVTRPPALSGIQGAWEPYGRGPLISNSPDYPSTSGLGLAKLAGRIDNLAYDAQNNRLFATKGTGGVWMSIDRGTTWRSVGDKLPSQIIAAVGWSTYSGGRLVALSGDPSLGGGSYSGFGAFYSTDLGASWKKATGIPDGAPGFAVEVDPARPNVVYAATFTGLYRSTDGGASYVNVNLPTGCPTGQVECYFANVVTDVIIKPPGGVGVSAIPAGTVLAVVGWPYGQRVRPDGIVESPNNGVYRSTTGAPGDFVKLAVPGFTQQDRIGRVELGGAWGPAQNHDYVYAIVQDAVAARGGLEIIDTPEGVNVTDPRPSTVLHGIYVSANFGESWTLMADDNMIAKNPATGSALTYAGATAGYEPGVQAWYNMWIAPDPTLALNGVPTRLAFGLEEVWQNEIVGQPLIGPTTFKVIGRYFSGDTCLLLGFDLPTCPTDRPPANSLTTHPDQQAGIWIPDATGVTLAVGNDGGFYKQRVAAGQELNNGGWGEGDQTGFNTLLPYDVAIAKDGTVYAGLQDNGHLKITPDRQQYTVYGGDGTFAEVDPDNSNVAYEATPFGAMRVSVNGGTGWRDIPTPTALTNERFVNPFEMDPTDARHLVTSGRQIAETVFGPDTGIVGNWTLVFNLGTANNRGSATATATSTDPANSVTALAVYGDAIYAGFCGACSIYGGSAPFLNGIATNVGGAVPPQRMTSNGWHFAAANGLPNRYITRIVIDPANPRTVYVALGGYSTRWIPPGIVQDPNANIGVGHVFRSTDAGENFVDISGNLPDAPATSIVLRGKQLIVGTDVGVFATDVRGGTTFALLGGLPVVPISQLQLAPGTCDLLIAATYGRGVYSFSFSKSAPKGTTCGVETAGTASTFPPERFHSGTHALWSDVTGYAYGYATRQIVLPASARQLSFWTWYDLEDGYDWAYVLISTDGGATWTSLQTTAANGSGTTTQNPIGDTGGVLGGSKKFPNGLTGQSGLPPTFAGQNALVPELTQHTADLSAYAGKTVLIRFAYSSDPATNFDGFFVDDVSITSDTGAVLFSDDMETSGTWNLAGNPAFRWVTAGS